MKAKIKFLKSAYVKTSKPRNWIKLIFLSLFSRFLYRHRDFDRDFLAELLVTSCFDHAWKFARTYFLSECHGWVYFLHFSGKTEALPADRLINVHSPELTAKSIKTGQCPRKVETSSSQYARNKVIRYFYASIFIRFGHVFVEKKL